MRPQHPGHFFMLFHQACDEVAGAGIAVFIGEWIDIAPDKIDDAFMKVFNQLADKARGYHLTALLTRQGA